MVVVVVGRGMFAFRGGREGARACSGEVACQEGQDEPAAGRA